MRTHRLRHCAEPGCSAPTIRRHCEAHESPAERELRSELDHALVTYADAEVAYVTAVRADAPLDVVEALGPFQSADMRVRLLEQRLGMVR